jgi:hypothetical protein
MIKWLVEHVRRMENAFDKEIPALRHLAKTQFSKEATVEEMALS